MFEFLRRIARSFHWPGAIPPGRRYYDGGTTYAKGWDPASDPDMPVREPRRSGPRGRNAASSVAEPEVEQSEDAIGRIRNSIRIIRRLTCDGADAPGARDVVAAVRGSSLTFGSRNFRRHKKMPRTSLQAIVISLALLLTGCTLNAPPMYGRDAREFLRNQGVEAALIEKLTNYEILTGADVAQLQGYDNVAVKHLLGANLGTPPELLTALANHPNFEVRTGVAANPKTPMAVLLSLRVPRRYDTVNLALSSNPMLPQKLLREMYNTGEADVYGLARNPNLPEDLMRAIDKKGDWLAHSALARNPSLPRDLLDKYLASDTPAVRAGAGSNAQINPRYKRPQDDMLGGP